MYLRKHLKKSLCPTHHTPSGKDKIYNIIVMNDNVHAIASKLHFALHAMAMLIVRSWSAHLTPIPVPSSTFAQASTLCVASGFAL